MMLMTKQTRQQCLHEFLLPLYSCFNPNPHPFIHTMQCNSFDCQYMSCPLAFKATDRVIMLFLSIWQRFLKNHSQTKNTLFYHGLKLNTIRHSIDKGFTWSPPQANTRSHNFTLLTQLPFLVVMTKCYPKSFDVARNREVNILLIHQ